MERITLGPSARTMREVEFEIEFGKRDKPLLLQGFEAGDLPMKSTVTFGESYYFEVPQDRRGKQVSIEMESTASYFGFSKEEEFDFRVPTQYDREFSVKGNRDSILVLRLVPGTTATTN